MASIDLSAPKPRAEGPLASSSGAHVTVKELPERLYAGIAASVTMQTIGSVYGDNMEMLNEFLGGKMAGPPFLNYKVIDMDRLLQVELGFPVTSIDGLKHPEGKNKQFVSAKLPAGRYACMVFKGHPGKLIQANADIQAWEKEQGPETKFDVRQTPEGSKWGARLEISLTDPQQQPDMEEWVTELQYLLR
ncbi:hypothetical protein DFJ74DRAFT_763218 [Hyaloraphidium curvatum]|nr:hypothetical protein DFJ74DRAFT_763218 [Hyaloraphidium curvatum]